jgi:hypothetical protein
MTDWLDSALEKLVFEAHLMGIFIVGSFISFSFPCYIWSIMAKESTGEINWVSILLGGGLIALVWGLITWGLFRFPFPAAPKWCINAVRCAVPILLTSSVICIYMVFLNAISKSPVKVPVDGFNAALAVLFSIGSALITFASIRPSTDAYLALRQTEHKSE